MKTNPQIDPQQEVELATLTEKEHEIILYNDDVNTFEHVIQCLITICDHSPEQAEQCAYLVHFSGKCAVKTGSLKDLVPRCTLLLDAGLSAEVI
ncbi:ATP-dependent Clp protease adaptor ClpS [Flavobacteriaceae bacterium]|nr:ATP-dependent Clp protease adaptor ClpS [Flavobacteriaceae bacterium]